jgi:surface antigen
MFKTMSISLRCFAFLAVLSLQACGGAPAAFTVSRESGPHYPGIACAPFARELSGIALYGDAASWWNQAAGRFVRGSRPVLGAALVFQRESRLPAGHVSVVSRILGPRQVEVTHANWVPGQLDEDQLIVDVSEHNDWSLIRVWYPPVHQLGAHLYAAYGFIHPPIITTRDDILRTARAAADIAVTSAEGRAPPTARRLMQRFQG